MRPRLGCNATHAPPRWPIDTLVAMPPHITAQCAPPSRPVSMAPTSTIQSGVILVAPWRLRRRLVIVDEDGERRRVEVFELPLLHRPRERPDRHDEQHERERDQQKQDGHAAT